MADVGGYIYVGDMPSAGHANAVLQSIDDAGEKMAFIFSAPASGPTITKVAVRPGALTGSSPTYVLSLQGLDATNVPDGTIKSGAGSNDVFVEITPAAGDAGVVKEYTLGGSGYNSSPGELLALVIEPKSGTTIDGSNYWSITQSFQGATGIPTLYTYAASAWTNVARSPSFGYSDGTSWWGEDLFSGNVANAMASGTDFIGNKFILPAVADTLTCVGFWLYVVNVGALTQRTTLYDASDTALASVDYANGPATGVFRLFWDDGPIALSTGVAYRLVTRNLGAGTLYTKQESWTAEAHKGTEMWGTAVQYTAGAVGGWTDTATARVTCGLIVSAITPPAAGGASPIFGDFTGGM